MRDNEINNLIDRLQGFDGDELQREMTDGLDEWCKRRGERRRAVRRVVLVALLLLTTTAIALTTVPQWRLSLKGEKPVEAPAAQPQRHTLQHTEVMPSEMVKPASEDAIDYYYAGRSEEGYSVTYGLDTRTLTYTRSVGNHIVRSVMHNAPDSLFYDSLTSSHTDSTPRTDTAALLATAAGTQVPCDFQTVSPQGDALYFTIVDSLSRHVSVRGDRASWMGQPIRYSAVLTLPATVEHDSILYTVTAIADSAFTGHNEIEALTIPATVSSIGDDAFAGCQALEGISVYAAVPPEVSPTAFDHVNAQLRLTVPCGSGNAYTNDTEWLYFRNVVEDCSSVKPRIRVVRKP